MADGELQMSVIGVVVVIVAVVILWRVGSFLVGVSRARRHPEMSEHMGPFWDAWEQRQGKVVPGRTSTYPPSGLFQSYVKAAEQTGVAPDEFLRQVGY